MFLSLLFLKTDIKSWLFSYVVLFMRFDKMNFIDPVSEQQKKGQSSCFV